VGGWGWEARRRVGCKCRAPSRSCCCCTESCCSAAQPRHTCIDCMAPAAAVWTHVVSTPIFNTVRPGSACGLIWSLTTLCCARCDSHSVRRAPQAGPPQTTCTYAQQDDSTQWNTKLVNQQGYRLIVAYSAAEQRSFPARSAHPKADCIEFHPQLWVLLQLQGTYCHIHALHL
jgi:hypothetical protein